MRKKMILRLSLLIVSLTLLWSCRNEDFVQAEKNPQRNNQDFFKHIKNNDAFARAGVDYVDILEAYNKEKDFLAQMPDQKGMPIWKKMQVVDAEGATGLMIPLSHDDETMSSVLFATLDSKNEVTGVKDYDNALLQNIVYDQKISKENREKLFLTFMQMDNITFGNEHFIGIPKDLFVGKKSDDEYGIMWVRNFALSSAATTDETGKLMIIESCFIALHCTHHGGGNICDAEDGCTECGTTFCTYEVIGTADDPFPSSPGGGGGGGGGGLPPSGPEGNIPNNPCGSNYSTVFYRLAPGCGGSGYPDLPELEDPCTKIKNKFNDSRFKEKVDEIDKPEKWAYDHEIGYASAYPTTAGVTETQYEFLDSDPGEHKVKLPPGNQYFGYIHLHNNDTATEAIVKIFSPADLAVFLIRCVSNADEHLSIGDAYAMVISSQGNYMLQYSGTGDYSIGPNQIENWKEWYLREFGKIQQEDGNFDQNDVEKLFARFLKESVKINGLEVYYVEKVTGKASKLNTNGIKTPCP